MTRYFTDSMLTPPLVLRRNDDGTDEAYQGGGTWLRTTLIRDYMAGNNDFVDDISEQAARKLAPAAFT
jgi:hypothetical protein